MRSSPGCDTWLHPPPPATVPQCSWFLNLGGIHVVFAMLKAKDKKNFCWLFICFFLGKTEFCMYNDLIQRTNDSIWIIHEAVVSKFRVYMLKTFLTHRWWMRSLHPYARGTIPYPFLSFPIPFLILLSAHNSFNVLTPPWHPCTVWNPGSFLPDWLHGRSSVNGISYLLMIFLVHQCSASIKKWLPNTNFNNPANWDKRRVPSDGEDVKLDKVLNVLVNSMYLTS